MRSVASSAVKYDHSTQGGGSALINGIWKQPRRITESFGGTTFTLKAGIVEASSLFVRWLTK